MKIAIIGGGAAGLMCGAVLSLNGLSATIFEGNEKVGKKLYITGKGRCNLTNACPPNEFLENVVNGQKFMQSSINRFSPFACMDFFEKHGLKLKTERGQRVFPQSDKSSDVIKTLEKLNVGNQIKLGCKVKNIKKVGQKFIVKTQYDCEEFDKVVVSTGGKSYSLTGSCGDGYVFAKSFGHEIVKQVPALVAIQLKDLFIKDLQGLSLKNVTLSADADGTCYSQFGEMMFTDVGITGPIVLTLSSKINRASLIKLYLDLKPALTCQQLNDRLLREFGQNQNRNISYIIQGLLPKKLCNIFLSKVNIPKDKKVNSITKEEREKIVQFLKCFDLHYKALYPIESAIITSGGVDLKQINPKSCESKLCQGLYFIGEVLNVDCLTGGFNLQTAFSTAYSCATDLINKN